VSAPEEIDHARGWMFVEKLLAEEDAGRVERLSDKELEDEMRAGGYDPALVPSAEVLLARVEARAAERAKTEAEAQGARVIPMRPPRRSHWVLTLVAAMFALFIVVMVRQGPAIVAFFKHEPAEIGPDNSWSPPRAPAPPTPAQKEAEAFRDKAVTHCDHMQWSMCRLNLDYAQALDPAGEDSPRVQKARAQIREIDEAPYSGDKPPGKKP
jgi:hypothetical protein